MKKLLWIVVVGLLGCGLPSRAEDPTISHDVTERHPHVGVVWPDGRRRIYCASSWEYGDLGHNNHDYSVYVIHPMDGGSITVREGKFIWQMSPPHARWKHDERVWSQP